MHGTAGSVHLSLPSHVFACRTSHGAVFIDLKQDRYYGIDNDAAAAIAPVIELRRQVVEQIARCDCSSGHGYPHESIAKLLESGLLVRGEPTASELRTESVDLGGKLISIGYELTDSATPRTADVANYFRAYLWARYSLKCRSFFSVAREVSRCKAGRNPDCAEPTADSDLVRVVSSFQAMRAFSFTARDQCLVHALTLVKFLTFYDHFPTWVIGVATEPWRAHSWVQHGSLLLDAIPEQVCEFTPILAI